MNAKFARAVRAAGQPPGDQLDVLADKMAKLVGAHGAEAARRHEEGTILPPAG